MKNPYKTKMAPRLKRKSAAFSLFQEEQQKIKNGRRTKENNEEGK